MDILMALLMAFVALVFLCACCCCMCRRRRNQGAIISLPPPVPAPNQPYPQQTMYAGPVQLVNSYPAPALQPAGYPPGGAPYPAGPAPYPMPAPYPAAAPYPAPAPTAPDNSHAYYGLGTPRWTVHALPPSYFEAINEVAKQPAYNPNH